MKRSVTKIKADPETGAIVEIEVGLKGTALTQLARALRLDKPEALIAMKADGPVQVILSKEDQVVL